MKKRNKKSASGKKFGDVTHTQSTNKKHCDVSCYTTNYSTDQKAPPFPEQPETRKTKDFSVLTDHLDTGEQNALHMGDLSQRCGLDERQLRHMVLSARLAGVPVLSSDEGYFMPASNGGAAECRRFIQRQKNRARTSFASIKAANLYLEENGDGAEGDL